jgi:hypothetical protein
MMRHSRALHSTNVSPYAMLPPSIQAIEDRVIEKQKLAMPPPEDLPPLAPGLFTSALNTIGNLVFGTSSSNSESQA